MERRREPSLSGASGTLALFLASSVAVALAISFVSWWYLPYEQLERFSPDERFELWEGVVWLVALVFAFLGLASVLEVLGWNLRQGVKEFLRSLKTLAPENLTDTGPVVLPWWLMSSGLLLIAIATIGRYMATS